MPDDPKLSVDFGTLLKLSAEIRLMIWKHFLRSENYHEPGEIDLPAPYPYSRPNALVIVSTSHAISEEILHELYCDGLCGSLYIPRSAAELLIEDRSINYETLRSTS